MSHESVAARITFDVPATVAPLSRSNPPAADVLPIERTPSVLPVAVYWIAPRLSWPPAAAMSRLSGWKYGKPWLPITARSVAVPSDARPAAVTPGRVPAGPPPQFAGLSQAVSEVVVLLQV